MQRVTAIIRRVAEAFGARAVAYYEREPVKVHNAIVTAVLAGATALGLTVLNPAIVLIAVTFVVPVVVQAIRESVFAPKTVAVMAVEAVRANAVTDDPTEPPGPVHPGDVSYVPEEDVPPEGENPDPRV